jgi:hypothetical protein
VNAYTYNRNIRIYENDGEKKQHSLYATKENALTYILFFLLRREGWAQMRVRGRWV